MRRTNIYLDDDQHQALKHLAAEEQQSQAMLVRRAIDEFLARHFKARGDWGERFDALVDRIQRRIPPGTTPEQIEADITTTRNEVSEARHVAREKTDARGR